MKYFALILLMILVTGLFGGVKAPDFKLEDMKGKQVKLSDVLKDGIVILDFWATFCNPCKEELPALDKLQKKYPDQIKVVAISADRARTKNKAKAYIKGKKYEMISLFDVNGEVQKLYKIKNIPRTFIIDQDRNIIYDHEGYKSGDENHLEEEILKLIKTNEKK